MLEIIVLRTHYYDRCVDDMVRSLRDHVRRPIIAVVDERRGAVELPVDVPKIGMDPAALGLLDHPDYGWRCGDYTLYAALRAVPSASAFWLIEPDVRIHSDHPKTFFDGTAASADADFVTAWFVQASANWAWYQSIAPFAERPFNCMLQLCRVSRAAVAGLYEQRRLLGERFQRERLDLQSWPNDEGFVGATLNQRGFGVATFADHAPGFRTSGTFTFTRPTSARWLDSIPPNDSIYHPVERGERFLARAQQYLGGSAPDDRMEEQIQIESREG